MKDEDRSGLRDKSGRMVRRLMEDQEKRLAAKRWMAGQKRCGAQRGLRLVQNSPGGRSLGWFDLHLSSVFGHGKEQTGKAGGGSSVPPPPFPSPA